MHEAIKRIFTVNLGVKRTERVLVFTDRVGIDEKVARAEIERRGELTEIAAAVARAGSEFSRTSFVEFEAVANHGAEPPRVLWEAGFGADALRALDADGTLERIIEKSATAEELRAAEETVRNHAAAPDAVIALSNYSTSHTRFRDLLTRCLGVRYASMPLFDRAMLDGAMSADWNEIKARTDRLVEMLSGADMVFITSDNGTSISFSMKGREVLPDTGILNEPGSFGNLPAGEAYLAPLEGTAEGKLVLDWAPTRKLVRPVELKVEKGLVVDVSGEEQMAGELSERIAENQLKGNIAELGIGTNDRATRPDNILETEKILSTVHIALGDNTSFGGNVSVPFHQDFIFFKPTVEAVRGEERIEILRKGIPRF